MWRMIGLGFFVLLCLSIKTVGTFLFLGLPLATAWMVPFLWKNKSPLVCLSSGPREVWIKHKHCTNASHSRWAGVNSAYREKGEITSHETVTLLSLHILLEAEKHTNFFLIVYLEFPLRWISVEFPSKYSNLYFVSDPDQKGNLPLLGAGEAAGLRAVFFSPERSGVLTTWCQERKVAWGFMK